jgi:GTP-binding protein
MVDGVVLLVDAAEGPLPQTKFVLGKALRLGLKPIVLINKVDRSDARAHEVHDEVFDLFSALDASDEQLDFPTLFASARQGWAATSLEAEHTDMTPLFELLVNHVPAPKVDPDPAFRMLVTTLEADNFLGRILTGAYPVGLDQAQLAGQGAAPRRQGNRADPHQAHPGLPRPRPRGARLGRGGRHHRHCRPEGRHRGRHAWATHHLRADQVQPIDPPTLAMTFRINDSPARRPRRRQGHFPHDPRPPDARGRGQRRHQGEPCPRKSTPSRSPAAASCSSAC